MKVHIVWGKDLRIWDTGFIIIIIIAIIIAIIVIIIIIFLLGFTDLVWWFFN